MSTRMGPTLSSSAMVVRSRVGVELEPAAVHERETRGDGGMTGQRDFLAGGEVARAEIGACAGSLGRRTKLVSERFCSRAMACIVAVSRSSASKTMAQALPESGRW